MLHITCRLIQGLGITGHIGGGKVIHLSRGQLGVTKA